MAKKKVFKTTTEYFYNDKGYVVKEIETVEEYEEEIVKDNNYVFTTSDVKIDIDLEKIKKEVEKESKKPLKYEWHKTTGVPSTVGGPHYSTTITSSDLGASNATFISDGSVVITGNLSVNEVVTAVNNAIASKVKKTNLTNDKAF